MHPKDNKRFHTNFELFQQHKKKLTALLASATRLEMSTMDCLTDDDKEDEEGEELHRHTGETTEASSTDLDEDEDSGPERQ